MATVLVVAGCGGGTTVRTTPPVGAPPERNGNWLINTSEPPRARSLATPHLALRGDGAGLVGVQGEGEGGASCDSASPGRGFVAHVAPDGIPGAMRPLHANLVAGPVALSSGRFAALLAEPQPDSTDCSLAGRMELAGLDGQARVRDRRELVPRAGAIDDAELAAIPGGGVAVAWLESTDDRNSTLLAAVRSPDGAVTRPVKLERREGADPEGPWISDMAIAVTPEGYVLVVYASAGAARAVTLDGAGREVRRARLGHAEAMTDVAVAAGAEGRAVAVWGGQDGGEERERPYEVRAATRRRGALRFGRAQLVDPGAAIESADNGPVAQLDDRGRAFLAWENIRGDGPDQSWDVYATRGTLGARFPPPVRVAHGYLVDALATPGDRPLVVSTSDDGPLDAHRGSVADPLRFERRERITRDLAYRASIAQVPGRPPLVAWGAGPEKRPFVRIARRRGA